MGFGLALLAGVLLAYQQGWVGAPEPVLYSAPPAPPKDELYTGSGSARFSIYAPQYPGSTVVEAARFDDAGGSGTMMAVMTTRDDPVDAAEFYRAALASKGFRPRVSGKGGRTLINGARPTAGLDVMVSVTRQADGLTRIELADNAAAPATAP